MAVQLACVPLLHLLPPLLVQHQWAPSGCAAYAGMCGSSGAAFGKRPLLFRRDTTHSVGKRPLLFRRNTTHSVGSSQPQPDGQ